MKNAIVLPALTILVASALPSSAQNAPSTFPVGGLQFQRPTEWSWVPVQNPMRKAQLLVPGMDPTKGADVTFFHFGPSSGGTVEENIQRWLKQFQSQPGAEKVEKKELGGRAVTLVSTEGTFASGMPGAGASPMEGFALLGAILEDSDGNVFVKMTGPKATVQGAREKFIAFIAGAKH